MCMYCNAGITWVCHQCKKVTEQKVLALYEPVEGCNCELCEKRRCEMKGEVFFEWNDQRFAEVGKRVLGEAPTGELFIVHCRGDGNWYLDYTTMPMTIKRWAYIDKFRSVGNKTLYFKES